MPVRIISGLIEARPCPRPRNIPVGRPRGVKAAGVRYENGLARALPAAKHGCWFEFIDRKGHGYCQTDLLLASNRALVILEAKYTWTQDGHDKLENMYIPVVSNALRTRAVGLVVCKRLTAGMPRGLHVVGDLETALSLAESGARVVFHWIGVPIVLASNAHGSGKATRPIGSALARTGTPA